MKTLFYITRKDNLNLECGEGSHVQFDNTGIGRKSRLQGTIRRDFDKVGDGIFWVMQRMLVLSARTTRQDLIENRMYEEAPVLEDGEIVEIVVLDDVTVVERNQYRVKILGDFSDCAVFEQIA